MMDVVVALAMAAAFAVVMGSLAVVVGYRRNKKAPPIEVTQGVTFEIAASKLGTGRIEVAELVSRSRLEIGRTADGVALITVASLAAELDRRSAHGPVRRAARRVWNVVKWLP